MINAELCLLMEPSPTWACNHGAESFGARRLPIMPTYLVMVNWSWRQGHELVLHILYQLFAEHSCSDTDSGASTSAAYDKFLLSLVGISLYSPMGFAYLLNSLVLVSEFD